MKDTQNTKTGKKSWLVGGGTLIGMGIGFIYLRESVLLSLACLFIGIGAGLVLGAFPDKTETE